MRRCFLSGVYKGTSETHTLVDILGKHTHVEQERSGDFMVSKWTGEETMLELHVALNQMPSSLGGTAIKLS